MILGVPTAIPYDVVKVGDDHYGSVFELLNAKSLLKLVMADPAGYDKQVATSVELLKTIHATEVDSDILPDMKEVALDFAHFLEDYLPEETYTKLCALIEAVPSDHHMMHGDYHMKNVMMQNGEALLIDMDTLCMGHPIFEFASIYNAYVGFDEGEPSNIEAFLGISAELAQQIWEKTMELYFDTTDQEKLTMLATKSQTDWLCTYDETFHSSWWLRGCTWTEKDCNL